MHRPLPAVRPQEEQHYPRHPPCEQRPDPPTARASPRVTPPRPLRRRRHRQGSRRRHWRGPARRRPCPWRRGSRRAARFASARVAPPACRALAQGARRSARRPPGEEEEARGEGGGHGQQGAVAARRSLRPLSPGSWCVTSPTLRVPRSGPGPRARVGVGVGVGVRVKIRVVRVRVKGSGPPAHLIGDATDSQWRASRDESARRGEVAMEA